MVVVPAGSFMMGSPAGEASRESDEGPQRKVTIPKPFALGKFEVTLAEWDACVTAGGCKHKPEDHGWGRGKRPAINVSWDDVTKEFVPWLSRKSGKTYRLLTEAEWEYAARAGTTTPFSTGGNITTEQAHFSGSFTPPLSRSVRSSRMASEFTTCTATSGSGSRTAGTTTIWGHRQTGRLG